MATKKHIELTDEQRAAYVESPFHCPFCGSTNILAGDSEADGRNVYQNVDCQNCGSYWTEEYTISGICNENDERED